MDLHMAPETVRVKYANEQGFCVINKDDFVAGTHELFEGEVPAQTEPEPINHAAVAQAAEEAAKKALEGSVVIPPAWQK